MTRTMLLISRGSADRTPGDVPLFRIEMYHVNRRLRPVLMISSAVVVIGVLLAMIAIRFARYA